jgi:hypothetical protein
MLLLPHTLLLLLLLRAEVSIPAFAACLRVAVACIQPPRKLHHALVNTD